MPLCPYYTKTAHSKDRLSLWAVILLSLLLLIVLRVNVTPIHVVEWQQLETVATYPIQEKHTNNSHVTDHVTDHVTGHVTGHVTDDVTDHVIDHVTDHVIYHMLISYMYIGTLLLSCTL